MSGFNGGGIEGYEKARVTNVDIKKALLAFKTNRSQPWYSYDKDYYRGDLKWLKN